MSTQKTPRRPARRSFVASAIFAIPLVSAAACGVRSRIAAASEPPKATKAATGSVVKLLPDDRGGFTLQKDGKPFFIKGAGGSAALGALKDAGGNSIRTWGADNLGPLLDEAQKLGLSVCVGIWFGHKEHGFKYDDPKQVAEQHERVRQTVLKYKDHPAVLLWALGNEMEGYAKGDDPLVWKSVNDAAVLVKQLDPNHPTMTVVAEIGGERVKAIQERCPAIDIIGINSYGGGASLPARYQAAGGKKPYAVTEFGPPGTWESGKNAWGAVPELNSGEKAVTYRRTYEGAISKQPLCIGSYAFTWGNKQEATATWYGMFLPDGSKLAAVDTMTELWSGKPPKDRCPEIEALKLDGPDQVAPGAQIRAVLTARDPEGQPLKVEWILQKDPMKDSLGGDKQDVPPTYPEAVVSGSEKGAQIRLPETPGAYRLFAYVRDGNKGAAVGNIPLFVEGAKGDTASAKSKPALRKATLPLVVFNPSGAQDATYIAAGWMGNTAAIRMDERFKEKAADGKTCLKVDYTAPNEWGGVVWQSPAGDWGEKPGGLDLTGAKRLVFRARGEKGGEEVTFQFGLLGKEKPYGDSATGKRDKVTLTSEWKEYSIDLAGKDLSRIKTGFCWTLAGQGKPVTFYLDNIRYE
jgi:hypothetical protein